MPDPATLTDAELCAAVAKEVLAQDNVEFDLHHGNRTGSVKWYDDKMDLHRLRLDWSGIGQVVEAMQERECYPHIELLDNGWLANHHLHYHHCGYPCSENEVVHENPARAVFEAALAAVRSVET